VQVRHNVRIRYPPRIPNPSPLLEQGNVFFVGHVTPLTAGMGFILAGAKTPINVRLGSCPKTICSAATAPADGVLRRVTACDTMA
jgi:hypothetical protein